MPNSEKTFTHYLNGSVIPEPGGFADFSEELIRDYDQKIISTKYPLDLVFTEGNYDVLRTLFLSGYCAVATYAATTTCEGEEFDCVRGTIKLGDVQWNLNKCSAQVPVADDGYGARIANNASIEATPEATITKNGLDLTPVTPVGIMYYASTGGALGVRSSYDWLECMDHIVRLITDNEVIVESAWYDDLPNDERYSIVYGLEMRLANGTSPAPLISYGKLYDELAKKYNLLGAIVRNTYGAPVFKIEPESYWNGDPDTPIHYIYNQDDLIQSVDSERLYASMRLGSKVFIKDQTNQFPYPFLNIRSFTDEVVNIVGTCNTDAQLDLTSEWIIDTNVIYDSIENGNDEYDDDIFLVQYNPVTFEATMGRYLVPLSDPLLYNEQLLNINVANRYDFQGDLAQFYAPQGAQFRAENLVLGIVPGQYYFWSFPFLSGSSGIQTSTLYQFRYNNDFTAPNFDVNNNYGNGTAQGSQVSQANSLYTAPTQGYYEFHEHTRWNVYRNFVFTIGEEDYTEVRTMRLEARLYDSANNLLLTSTHTDTYTIPLGAAAGIIEYGSDFYFDFTMSVGDYVTIHKLYEWSMSGGSEPITDNEIVFRALTGSYWETSFVAPGGGTIPGDPDNYRAVVHEFDRHLTDGVWNQIKDAPESNIVVSTGDQPMYPGVPYIISRNVSTGKTTWKLLSTFADIQ